MGDEEISMEKFYILSKASFEGIEVETTLQKDELEFLQTLVEGFLENINLCIRPHNDCTLLEKIQKAENDGRELLDKLKKLIEGIK